MEKRRRIIPIVIDDDGTSHLPLPLRQFQWADFRRDYNHALRDLVEGIRFLQQPGPIERPDLKSKGYVFVSYADEDSSFMNELRAFLAERGYAYWDFRESDRDYTVDYSMELEGVIQEAAGTLSIISPNWKKSKTSMKEFHFSEDVGTPVFLLKVGDPGPTLALAGLTFIDFTQDHASGFVTLDRELKRKLL